ncbi:MAG: acyl-CoA thioesterase [Burkholderiaceae bacterium]
MLQREPSSTRIVAFKDCDAFGLLYNTRYLDYVMDVRAEHLMKFYDLDFYRDCQVKQETWVVQGHQVAYIEPARAHEQILVRTRMFEVGKNSSQIEGLIFSGDGGRLKFIQWTKLTYISLSSGAVQHYSPEMADFLDRFRAVEDVPKAGNFDERVKQLRLRHATPRKER